MSQILDYALVQPPPAGSTASVKAKAWLILDCGHWYQWDGDELPKRDGEFPCPDCRPPIQVIDKAEPKLPGIRIIREGSEPESK